MGLWALIFAIFGFMLAALGTAPWFLFLMVLGLPLTVASILLAVIELARSARRGLRDEDVPDDQAGYVRYALQGLGLSAVSLAWMSLMFLLRGGIM